MSRKSGKMIASGRVTVDKDFRDKLGLSEGDMYEQEVIGADTDHPKVVFTFFKALRSAKERR